MAAVLVQADELVAYMSDISLSESQEAAITDVLAGVQSQLEDFLQRPIEPRQFTEVVRASHEGYVLPKYTPVVSIDAIENWTGALTYEKGIGVYVASPYTDWSVTYTAGLDGSEIPGMKLAIMRVAKREVQNLHDDTLGVKDLQTDDVPPLSEGWTQDELWRFARYKRRTSG